MYIIMHVKIGHTYRDFDPILEQLKKIVKKSKCDRNQLKLEA